MRWRDFYEEARRRAMRWMCGAGDADVVFCDPMMAAMIATSIAMMALSLLMGKKSKGKNSNQDPIIGNRYWSDNIEAFAYYSPRTAKLWYNQMFLNQEEFFPVDYLPMAESYGDAYDFGARATNSGAVNGFTLAYPGSAMPLDYFEDVEELQRLCKLPTFTRGGAENPKYPAHQPGVAALYINQGFMGLNAATVGNYRAVLSVYPGTVYMLMAQGTEYADEGLWVRYRDTADCGLTITINPIAIILDILLDRYKYDEIDFLSAADVGKRLIVEYPYMWFSLAQPPQKYKELLKDLSAKSKINMRRTADGKIGFKLYGETPPGGIETVPVIDVVRDVIEVSLEKPSIENADVINEARATYLAARYDADGYTVFSSTQGGVAAAEALNTAKHNHVVAQTAYDDAVAAHPGDPTHPDVVAAYDALQVAELAQADQESAYSAAAEAYALAQSSQEGHFLQAGVFAVNAASIVLTGVRRQKSYSLDYLNWPDDAKAYIEEALILYENPLNSGSITTTFAYNELEVGSLFKLQIVDAASTLDYRFIAEVAEKTIMGYGEEKMKITFKESGKWYGVLTGEPNTSTNPGVVDATPGEYSGAVLLPVWAINAQISPLLRGFPAAAFCCQANSHALDAISYYLVTDCINAAKEDDNFLAQEASDLTVVGVLQHDFDIADIKPGFLGSATLTMTVPFDGVVEKLPILAFLQQRADIYGGVIDRFFMPDFAPDNYVILTKASALAATNDAGLGFYVRCANIAVNDTGTELVVVLSGLYACDISYTGASFAAGDYVALLPETNSNYGYGFTAAPVPASIGHTNQIGSQTFKARAVPANGLNELAWPSCMCAMYSPDDSWLTAQKALVYAQNLARPSYADPFTRVYAVPGEDIEFWLNLLDYRVLAVDHDLLDITRAFPGHGPDLDTGAAETPATNTTIGSGTGAENAVVVLSFINATTSAVLRTMTLLGERCRVRFKLEDIVATYDGSYAIATRVSLGYKIAANPSLDQETQIQSVTFNGPEIVYG